MREVSLLPDSLVPILALSFTSCMTVAKLLYLPVPQMPHL